MAYLKPPAFTRRVFNPIAMWLGLSGVHTLRVARRSGDGTQTLPVIPVDHDGARYLVSPRGETQWVRNLRAADGRGELVHRKQVERFVGSEVPVADRGPILETYRSVAGRAVRGYFEQLPDAVDHPTFRLAPA